MKDSINNIETRVETNNNNSNEILNELYNTKQPSYYLLDKFPKEFKKDILKSFDVRFMTILFFSFFFHISLLIFFKTKFPAQINSKTITKIQQQYVDLLLEDKESPLSSYDNVVDYKYKLDSKTITGLSEWLDTFADKALKSIKDMSFSKPKETKVPERETIVPSKEEITTARKTAAKGRIRSLSDLEKEVSSIGLLGIINSKTTFMDYEYIDDILEYTEINNNHLANVLSKLSSIRVPHHKTAGYILSYKRSHNMQGGQLKGGRKHAGSDMRQVLKDIKPLATAKTTKMNRTMKYENIPSSYLQKLRPQYGDGTTRSTKDVVRVVQSHKRALQDCYKQELKFNALVHGKIIVRFTVDPEGNVVRASIVSSTLNSSRMERCVLNRVRKWRNFGYCDPSIGNITYKQAFNFGR